MEAHSGDLSDARKDRSIPGWLSLGGLGRAWAGEGQAECTTFHSKDVEGRQTLSL